MSWNSGWIAASYGSDEAGLSEWLEGYREYQ